MNDSIDFAKGAVVSKIVSRSEGGNISLFAFDKGQILSEHTAPYDAMVQVIEGDSKITIDKVDHFLGTGDFIIMPANVPHALEAKSQFKMILIMIKNI